MPLSVQLTPLDAKAALHADMLASLVVAQHPVPLVVPQSSGTLDPELMLQQVRTETVLSRDAMKESAMPAECGAQTNKADATLTEPTLSEQDEVFWAAMLKLRPSLQTDDDTDTLGSYNSDAEDFREATTLAESVVGGGIPMTSNGRADAARPFRSASTALPPKPTFVRALVSASRRSISYQGLFPSMDMQLPDLRQYWPRKQEQSLPFLATHAYLAPEQLAYPLNTLQDCVEGCWEANENFPARIST